MFARVSTYSGEGDALVEGFSDQTDAIEQVEGFERAYLLVDREKGKAISITFWASESALEQSAEQANRMREEATSPSGGSIESVESYEVAITAAST
jgi:heme-degrading monooxygenase HmoA